MDDKLRIRVFAQRLRLLVMQLESGNFSMKDVGDLFALDEGQDVSDFLRGELKLRSDYEQALRLLAAAGNKSAMAATASLNKQFASGELEAIVAQATKRKR